MTLHLTREKVALVQPIINMNYYSKDVYQRERFLSCLDEITPFSEDISFEELYSRYLSARLKKAENDFNTPTKMLLTREEVIASYDEKKYPKYDFVSRRVVGYSTLEEVLRSYDDQAYKLQMRFASRGEFDKERMTNIIFQQYIDELKDISEKYPSFVLEEMDLRILAIHYMPLFLYDKTKAYIEESKKIIALKNDEYQKALEEKKSSFSSSVISFIERRKDDVVSLVKEDKNIVLYTHFAGLKKAYSTGVSKYVFKNANLVLNENEELLHDNFLRKNIYDQYLKIHYLEVDHIQDKYVFSFLLIDKQKKPYYLSITSEDIEIVDNA